MRKLRLTLLCLIAFSSGCLSVARTVTEWACHDLCIENGGSEESCWQQCGRDEFGRRADLLP
jgi:hypothetical protein